MQETTDIYVGWLNFVKMEANVEKCIHIRSIPRELKTEGLEKQIERIIWEAKEKYKKTMEEALEETGWKRLEEGTIRTQIIKQMYMIKGKEKTEEVIKETEKRKEHEGYVKWWKGEQEEEKNTRERLEQTAQIFNVEWINIKKGRRGWVIENRNNETEEMKELSQPKSEEVIASIQEEEDINILTRWVPKINSEGEKKPVTRLKKGEHTRYLGAWLAEGIDDKEQIKRLDRIIKA